MGPWDQTEVNRFGVKYAYLLSHLTSTQDLLFCILFFSLKNISPDDAYEKLCLIFNGYKTISHLILQGGNLDSMHHSLCEVLKNPACNLKFLRSVSSFPKSLVI
jgi:hypothetical protein